MAFGKKVPEPFVSHIPLSDPPDTKPDKGTLFSVVQIETLVPAFTETELKQLVAFYSSSLGKKISSKTPELMQNCMMMDQQVLAQHITELQSIIEGSVKE